MSEARGPRVLVAVEPVVLEGAFAAILELIGIDEVVQFHGATEAERSARYDAAIVSAGFPHVSAEIVITLPDTRSTAGQSGAHHRGQITTGESSDEVDIRDQQEVINLLDAHLPTEVSRRDRLRDAHKRIPG